MIRLAIPLILILAFFGTLGLKWAARNLPPAVFVLGVPLLVLVGGVLVFYLGKRAFFELVLTPFKMKGRVLRGAASEVHAVEKKENAVWRRRPPEEAGSAPDDDEDEKTADNTPRVYYQVEVTITPEATGGAFQHWDIDDLTLVPFDSKPNPRPDGDDGDDGT